jgi:hypothetical protein
VNPSLDTRDAAAVSPRDDWGEREAALIAHVRETFIGTDSPQNVLIAAEGEPGICVLPHARAQIALYQIGGLALVDLVSAVERPAQPHILAVLVFTDRIGLAWLALTFCGFSQR